jgi:hypothetical protein
LQNDVGAQGVVREEVVLAVDDERDRMIATAVQVVDEVVCDFSSVERVARPIWKCSLLGDRALRYYYHCYQAHQRCTWIRYEGQASWRPRHANHLPKEEVRTIFDHIDLLCYECLNPQL